MAFFILWQVFFVYVYYYTFAFFGELIALNQLLQPFAQNEETVSDKRVTLPDGVFLLEHPQSFESSHHKRNYEISGG